MSNTNKWVLAMVLGVMAWGTALAQPANNTCATAANMTIGTPFTATNMGATTETVPACPGTETSNHTVWYRFTGNGAAVTLTTCGGGTNFDTQIQVYSGTCAALVPVACNNNDNTCSYVRASRVGFTTALGTVYYVRIGGVLGARGTFTLSSSTTAPVNGACANAIAIGCGSAVSGNTIGAPVHPVPTCGTALNTAPGVWYTFQGTGALVTVETCGSAFDTKLGVFTGSCGTFTCVGGNDDACGLQSRVNFTSVSGTTYYVLVTGFSAASGGFVLNVSCASTPPPPPPPSNGCTTGTSWGGGTVQTDGNEVVFATCYFAGEYAPVTLAGDGPFTFTSSVSSDFLTVTNSTGTTILAFGNTPLVFEAPAAGAYRVYVHTNNQCGTQSACRALRGRFTGGAPSDFCATALNFTLGETVVGTNQGATTETVPSCFDTETSYHTVWYRFTGNGANIILSTCGGTDFDSQIEVFTGTCTSLTSVACNNNDYDCGFTRASTVSFQTTSGTVYYVRIGGVLGARGNFTLTSTIIRPENSDCEDAISVSCGSNVTGTTAFATVEPVGTCVTALGTAPGVWYTYEGNGDIVTVETCGSGFNTKLGVFTGSCGVFTCVTGNDNACGLQSRVVFLSETGVTYYILVTGAGTAQGNFTLNVSCITPEPDNNDICADAFVVTCGSVTQGTTIGATPDAVGTCGTALNTAAGVWYSFVGTGQFTTVSLCGSGFDTKVGVFSGTCGALTCIAGNDDFCGLQSQVSFGAQNGVTYYILVTGFSASAGNFTLSITCTNPPANDLCANATPFPAISANGACSNVTVSTVAATGSPDPTCTGNEDDDVFYTFTVPMGFSSLLYANTNISGNTNRVLQVLTACGGTSLGCYDPESGTITGLVGGQTYILRAYTFGTGVSTVFNLCLRVPPPAAANDVCANAINMACGDVATGSTVSATTDAVATCGTTLNTAPGVWYSFVGTGGQIVVSTCNPGTNYDTKLGVFSGACGALTCVGGNDDSSDPGCQIGGLNRKSKVTFTSQAGIAYYVLVTGFGTAAGEFELSVTCTGGGALAADITPGAVQQDVQFVDLNVGELYPNPARAGQVFVDIATAEEGVANIQVFDQVGRIVINTTTELYGGTNKVVINADKLATGTYFATIRVNDELVRRKLVVIQ